MVEMLPCFYIYSLWSSHSSAWSQCERSVWHWYRAADETLLIGYSTLNKDVSSLISNFFNARTINLIFGQLFLQCGSSPSVLMPFLCTGCCSYSKRQTVKCSGRPLAVYRR